MILVELGTQVLRDLIKLTRRVLAPPRQLKPFAASIRREFVAHGVEALYHATDRANLDSIRSSGGLFSWAGCATRGIEIPKAGGDDESRNSDRKKGLEHYVRLSFNRNQPQVYAWWITGRVTRVAWLRIDPSVATWHDTKFSNENAVKNEAKVGEDIAAFREIRLGIATASRWSGEEEKRYYQAEVLVRDHVPLEMILNLDDFK